MITILVFLLVLFLCYVYKLQKEFPTYPPGPFRWPILIHWPAVNFKIGSRVIIESIPLIRKCGDVLGLVFGTHKAKIVIIQSLEKAKEMTNNEDFNMRCAVRDLDVKRRKCGGYGIVTNYGHSWKVLRRFSLSTLKDFGFGKKSMEVHIMEEVMEAMKAMERHADQDMKVFLFFNIFALNVIWRITGSTRYHHEDPKIKSLVEGLNVVFKYAFTTIGFPFLPDWMSGVKAKVEHEDQLKHLFVELIEEHKRTYVPGQRRDFMDAYLEAANQSPPEMSHEDVNNEVMSHEERCSAFTTENLLGCCMDFFQAGGETIGATMAWALMFMARNPKAQEKCQQEMDSALGVRLPSLDDKPRLPWCEATVMEIQRMASVAPAGMERTPLRDTEIFGYTIPWGTMVYYNIYHFHHDPAVWTKPEEFNPARFLDDNGKVTRPDHFVPFGVGKRQCMGEALAKAELFLFFTTLLQHYSVLLPKRHSEPDPKDDVCGMTRSPNPFYVHIVKRKNIEE